MMWILYYTGIYFFVLLVRISSIWNAKSKQWLTGRKHWTSIKIPAPSEYRIWFHVASLGEFEQARPVIERIKELRPSTEIVLTFFSPSGYEQRKNYTLASVYYLPADLPGVASRWLDHVNPDMAVFVKYDLWPGYLKAILKKKIPAILISANWTNGSKFSSWSNPLNRNLLKKFKMIFLQQENDLKAIQNNGFNNVTVAGDTRVDRVLKIPFETKEKIPPVIRNLNKVDIVAGSTWPEDEDLLLDVIETLNLKAIIVPHDPSNNNVNRILNKSKKDSIRLTAMKNAEANPDIIIIDRIGLLSSLYSMGDIAYVGGGFGAGIHSILEPMAHSKPVIFGPGYHKFPEATDMIHLNGAMAIKNKEELLVAIKKLKQPGLAESTGKISMQYLETHAGATEIVTDYILKSIPYIA
jgi:3-deoxy-D-manno-octulosonic-acid transferase